MRILIIITLFITSFNSASGQIVKADLEPVEKDYYAWITSLNEGPIEWLTVSTNDIDAKAYRIVITTSEIYNSLYVETVVFGNEGCCKRIVAKHQIDLYDLFSKLKMSGEITNIEFTKWLNNGEFEMNIQDQSYLLSIEEDHVEVSQIN
ncbi:hypothetical protein [Marivirga arenosa]|uniref:Uncharacterized protein n=1 Tax=Marivirga arenosa TaxID=3059076 RepID=A0AA49GES7_9BACT|nr:hypothetical protein [Marivirga sp. BKB1-2]WKK82935.1 hypothetical protein QYS47_13585 [Marivirga sp. BKB1-2]